MKKILVLLEVPSISKGYDVYIPDFLEVKELTALIIKAVEQMSDHQYVSSGHEFLCVKEKNLLLKQGETLEKYGIKNGDHLILL